MEVQRPQNQLDESRLVPWWSIALGVAAFIGWQMLVHLVLVPRNPKPQPLALTIFWGVLVGMFFAFNMVMIGYVTRDTKRRGMSTALWTSIMILLLGTGIGFIMYFMLRSPVERRCYACSWKVREDYNYCPRCQNQLRQVCPECKHGVDLSDAYCHNCSALVAPDRVSVSR